MRPQITTPKVYFQLPDLLEDWPYKRIINQHFHDVAAVSADWIDDFNAFSFKRRVAFRKANFGLIASLAYPHASSAHLRTGCDLMNTFFAFDDISDDQCAADVRKEVEIIMDALRNPNKPRPEGESVLGEIHRCFWSLACKTASATAKRRFLLHYEEYAEAVVQQAEDRDKCHIRSISEYLDLRRRTIGAKPSFDLLLLPLDLPDHILDHPVITELMFLSVDMIILANDVYSYNVEQSRGDDGHNMVAVAMKERSLSVQGAMDYIGEETYKLASRFVTLSKQLPTFGVDGDSKVSHAVEQYVWGLGNWVTANIEWSFESERYFGTHGLEIMKHLKVELLPKQEKKN